MRVDDGARVARAPSTMIAAGKPIEHEADPEPPGGWRSNVPRRCHTRPSTAKIPLPRRRFWLRVAMNRTVAACWGRSTRQALDLEAVLGRRASGSGCRVLLAVFRVFSSMAWVPFFRVTELSGGLAATARRGRF